MQRWQGCHVVSYPFLGSKQFPLAQPNKLFSRMVVRLITVRGEVREVE